MSLPQPGDYAPFALTYVSLVQAGTIQEAIEKYHPFIIEAIENIAADKADFSYAAGKWTLKEVLQHVIDTERIFTYRAVCIARGDTTPLPGFDENTYAANSQANNRPWPQLVQEFKAVRHATNLLFGSFTLQQLQNRGTASNYPVTINAIGFITLGHLLHHINVVNERYL